jgi:hypothetical protein
MELSSLGELIPENFIENKQYDLKVTFLKLIKITHEPYKKFKMALECGFRA